MGTSAMQDDPMLRLRYYRETGQSDEAQHYENYLRQTGQYHEPHDFHAEYRSGQLAKRMQRENANDQEQADAETPGYATQALGGIASLAKDIPFAESAQAGVRSVLRGQPYRQALQDIQGAEADAPSGVRNLNRMAGGAVAASAMPGGVLRAGARYGILSGLGQSDPDADIHDRIKSAAWRGATTAVAGKIANAGLTGLRGVFAPSSGAASAARSAAIKEADQAAYGQAAAEGAAAGGTSPAIKAALEQPDIAPYAEAIRGSRLHAGADDATVLREAYKLMSERQGLLGNRILNTGDYKAGTSLENADVGLAKREMLRAAETPWTKQTPAVQQTIPADIRQASPISTAQSPPPSLMDALDAFRAKAAEAARRATGGATPNTNPFSSQPSAETFAQRVARETLERQGAISSISPRITGTPPGPRTVEMSPPNTVELSPATATPMPAVMPSLRSAVEQHAEMAGDRSAFRTMSDAAGRAINKSMIPAKKLDRQSEEALLEAIRKMKEEAANAGLEGTLGRLKDSYHSTMNPLKMLGNASRVSPYVNALDQQIDHGTSAFWPAVRNAFIGSGPPTLLSYLHQAGIQ